MELSCFLESAFTFSVILIALRSFPILFDAISSAAALIALIHIFEVVKNLLKKHFLSKRLPSRNKAVLITGCDSGFGNRLAVRLDQLGYRVFAACLFPEGEGAQDLKRVTSPKLQILGLDVTKQQNVNDALEFVKKNLTTDEVFWAVVNNAGVGQSGEIEWTSVDEFSRVFDVNTLGVVRVTKAFLPLLRKSKGRVVNNTSLNGRLTCPGFVGYCMSKTAAVSFTNGLRIEMAKWGVKVTSIEPFFYRTPITEKERNLKLIESTFDEAPDDIKEAYGKEYLKSFKNRCEKLLERSNPNIEEVIDCFEDAITAEDPQPDYFPCYLPHKIMLKLWRVLPQPLVDRFQVSQTANLATPRALSQ